MKSLFKNPLLYANVLLLALVLVLAPSAAPNYAKAYGFVRSAFAAVVGPINGAGTLNFIARFADATPSYEIGDSIIYDDGAAPRKIGIDTTSPGAKLDINATADPLLRLRQGANPATTFRVGTNGAMVIDNDGVSDVFTLDSGKVGIGTANPTNLLTLGSPNSIISTNSADGSDNKRITLTGGGANGRSRGAQITVFGNEYIGNAALLELASGDEGSINFYTSTVAGGQGQHMIITKDGRVGIGNTSPGVSLHVGASANTTGKNIRVSSDSGDMSLFIQGSAEAGAHAGFGRASKIIGQQASYPMVISNNATQPIVFGTNDTERMRITGTGNVGIGITSPQAPLHVNGPVIIGPKGSYTPVDGMMWMEP